MKKTDKKYTWIGLILLLISVIASLFLLRKKSNVSKLGVVKRIIQRNLPLNVKYILTDKKYIPLEQSFGLCCDNCGKLITNIATVKNENGDVFDIGFDCLETILINNSLLSTNDILQYEAAKKMIPKILRFSKTIKETLDKNRGLITGIRFEKQWDDYFTFYWLVNNEAKSRNNDVVKLKEMDRAFLIETLKNIFPKLLIIAE